MFPLFLFSYFSFLNFLFLTPYSLLPTPRGIIPSYIAFQIRQGFLDYFHEHRHHNVASPVLPARHADDPTLLFTNAGMVQFKDAFLGLERTVLQARDRFQKCMRVAVT
ncbi:MAG: alanine--tRNA ligase-related protein [Anaerolineae bacterium]